MPDAAKRFTGKAIISGIAGAPSFNASTTDHNLSEASLSKPFDMDEIKSPSGATVRTKVFSMQRKEVTLRLYPQGVDQAAAVTAAKAYLDLTPGAVITLAGFTMDWLNGTYNYVGGAEASMGPDVHMLIGVQLSAPEVEGTAGTYAALPVVT